MASRVRVGLGAAVLLLAACGAPSASPTSSPRAASPSAPAATTATTTAPTSAAAPAAAPVPLRKGERFVTVKMGRAYTPRAPSTGTDDYRCFLLDPRLKRDSFVTGLNVLPGNAHVVHHVILFRVPPSDVARADALDGKDGRPGWTCFGGSGLEAQGGSLDSAPWLGAWAPGGGESTLAPDLGIPLKARSRIIMQVHYNLLAGRSPDISSAKLRVTNASSARRALDTILLPAPVNLPCRPGKTGPLCDYRAASADLQDRFGAMAAKTNDLLNLFCQSPLPGPTQSCTRPVRERATIRAVAGHMHLLGRRITIVVNKGKPDARTVLDIPVWDFDNQASRPLRKPLAIGPGDTLTVTCTHDQALRDIQPAFAGRPERFVMWGEGTTDEMCLGIVLVTRP
ncbi:MAG TPA: hypothetical protein VFJ22_00110 [Dermatophilaceae bacterium]|nr:hypothetical protein [Dermatophilaceae bacterium]